MTREHDDAVRLSRGASPADVVARREAPRAESGAAPPDPLTLCIAATVAALGWLLGPAALALFAGIAFVAYWRAWRAGLARSRCWLRDTRLVLLYLGLLAAAGIAGLTLWVVSLVP